MCPRVVTDDSYTSFISVFIFSAALSIYSDFRHVRVIEKPKSATGNEAGILLTT